MDACFRFFWILIVLVGGSPVASALGIALVTDRQVSSVQELEQHLEKRLNADCDVILTDDGFTAGKSYDLVLLAGPGALEQWPRINNRPNVPVIAAFSSKQDIELAGVHLDSAVYLEPPLTRQIALAEGVLGAEVPLGVLANNAASLQKIGVDISRLGRHTDIFYVDDYDSLNRALVALLRDNMALVGVYDPELFSASNIKNILITAYRQNRPLFGPSSAYIRAGALATTFSDVEDVAARLSDIIQQGRSGRGWPVPDYNPYFRVRYNQQVARSLNLSLPDADELARKLGSKVAP
ncbi:hypothetical protein [Parathalassolituus penaei]|uniref:ABC transporter substrate-binding protein n=1 Tax=Parathalassolituus penaei TaxID=2997323 RepID=A0A9X3EBF4_9GAMM|nr:hypothetical protein [Parathalassolituus penaei]MCY0964458.1 hypothetical protein [Parathalassolituus penaei]